VVIKEQPRLRFQNQQLRTEGDYHIITYLNSSHFRFTLVAWIYAKRFHDDRIIDKNTAGWVTGYEFDVFGFSGRGYLRLCAAGECISGKRPLWLETWYHVAVVFDGIKRTVSFYVDGEQGLSFHEISISLISLLTPRALLFLESVTRMRAYTTLGYNGLCWLVSIKQ